MTGETISTEIRRKIAEFSHYRCGYCLTSQHIVGPLLELDHIFPESKGGTADEENLILACPMCNSHKSDRVEGLDPDTGQIVPFFNPRKDMWDVHFEWVNEGTTLQGLTSTGRATIIALHINHPDTIAARQLWVAAGWHPPED